MKIYIRSFALNKREIRSDLRAAADIVIEHLIKIFLYPRLQEQNHWKQEIAAALKKVPRLKNSNKFPDASFIVDSSWMVWEDQFDRFVEVVKEDMEENPNNSSTKKLYEAIDEYFNWISDKLSTFGAVSNKEIYNEIELLQNKYFRR